MKLNAWRLVVRIKKGDQIHGKSIERILMDLLEDNKIWGATVWSGVDGFGKRGKSVRRVEGITFDNPLLIEIIDEKEKLELLLVQIKQLVGDNGLVTLEDVGVV